MNRTNYAEWRRVVVGIRIISSGNHPNSRGPANEWLCPGNCIPWIPTGRKEQVLERVGNNANGRLCRAEGSGEPRGAVG